MNELQTTKFMDIEIRYSNDVEPLFMLGDICKALGLTNPTMAKKSVFPDYIKKEFFKSGNRSIKANALTEAGLYQLIMLSRKDEAIKFQRYIFEDLLPRIRKENFFANLEENESTILGKSFARIMSKR
jgi:prophage antirepressor-like protein